MCLSLVAQSCPTLCNPARYLCPWDFSRQEHWSGLQFPSPVDLPNPSSSLSSFSWNWTKNPEEVRILANGRIMRCSRSVITPGHLQAQIQREQKVWIWKGCLLVAERSRLGIHGVLLMVQNSSEIYQLLPHDPRASPSPELGIHVPSIPSGSNLGFHPFLPPLCPLLSLSVTRKVN